MVPVTHQENQRGASPTVAKKSPPPTASISKPQPRGDVANRKLARNISENRSGSSKDKTLIPRGKVGDDISQYPILPIPEFNMYEVLDEPLPEDSVNDQKVDSKKLSSKQQSSKTNNSQIKSNKKDIKEDTGANLNKKDSRRGNEARNKKGNNTKNKRRKSNNANNGQPHKDDGKKKIESQTKEEKKKHDTGQVEISRDAEMDDAPEAQSLDPIHLFNSLMAEEADYKIPTGTLVDLHIFTNNAKSPWLLTELNQGRKLVLIKLDGKKTVIAELEISLLPKQKALFLNPKMGNDLQIYLGARKNEFGHVKSPSTRMLAEEEWKTAWIFVSRELLSKAELALLWSSVHNENVAMKKLLLKAQQKLLLVIHIIGDFEDERKFKCMPSASSEFDSGSDSDYDGTLNYKTLKENLEMLKKNHALFAELKEYLSCTDDSINIFDDAPTFNVLYREIAPRISVTETESYLEVHDPEISLKDQKANDINGSPKQDPHVQDLKTSFNRICLNGKKKNEIPQENSFSGFQIAAFGKPSRFMLCTVITPYRQYATNSRSNWTQLVSSYAIRFPAMKVGESTPDVSYLVVVKGESSILEKEMNQVWDFIEGRERNLQVTNIVLVIKLDHNQ